jgi:hypothetical protein
MTVLSSLELAHVTGGQMAASDLARTDLQVQQLLRGGSSDGDLVVCQPLGPKGSWNCGVFAPDAQQGDAAKRTFTLYPQTEPVLPQAQ